MDYEKYLQCNQTEMIESLQDLVRCKSDQAEPQTAADGQVFPFGAGVQEALEKTLALGAKMGFQTRNVDNYGGHIDFVGTGRTIVDAKGKVTGHAAPKIMAIIGHLDVVPAGDGWEGDPYSGELKDGKIWGRGTTDDKGPVISCLYAMKALKDAGYQPVDTIRLILGLDEETDWKGMDYYFSKVERPDYGFTPDGDFPLINGEKGLLIFDLARKFNGVGQAGAARSAGKGLQLRQIKGGTAPNSVPATCRAVVRSDVAGAYDEIRQKAEKFCEETGYKLKCRGMGKSLELTSAGKSAHGARPELGLNAISVMMEFLHGLNFTCEDHNDFIAFYHEYIGFCLDGAKMGCDLQDERSGKLVFNVGMIDVEPEAGKLTINIRYPVSNTAEDVFGPMEEIIGRYDMGLIKGKDQAPIYFELDNPMVETLLAVYREHSGDTENQPKVIGGGTYARSTEGVIAYGAMFPGDEDRMHMANEYLRVDRFVQMTEIYAEAIYRLSQGEQ